MNWSKELPQEEGDYLWVSMWGCNCCISDNGIATVHEVPEVEEKDSKCVFKYLTKDGSRWMGLFGRDSDIPKIEEGLYPEVDGWLLLTDLPKAQPADSSGRVTYKNGSR